MRQLIIIGSGPAGYTAAIYAARAQLEPLLIASSVEVGGELMNTTEVENFPGFPDGIQGPELMMQMQEQAEKFGTEVVYDDVVNLELDGDVKTVTLGSGETHRGPGGDLRDRLRLPQARPRRRGAPLGPRRLLVRHLRRLLLQGEDHRRRRRRRLRHGGGHLPHPLRLQGRTSSTARTSCAPPRSCRSAPSTTRRSSSSGTARSSASPATDAVSGLMLRDTVTGEQSELALGGLFVAIGNDPRTHLVHGQLRADRRGHDRRRRSRRRRPP